MFEEGREYHRRTDIHREYGGQEQGGISTPRNHPYIFLFYSDSGESFGYKDGWDDASETFYYTGHGQRGDMELGRGNLAIRNHDQQGKELHLFRKSRNGWYRYEGELRYQSHEVVDGVSDADGRSRTAIVFTLLRVHAQ